MDSKIILEAARGTLDGTLSFPEVVGQLLAAGVEYYHVDYVGLRKRFYSAEGEMMATSINYEGLPPVAPEFDAAALGANILDSQRHNQPYREFTRRGPCRTGHLVTGRAAVPRSQLYLGGAAATALPMAQARHLLGPHRRPAHGMVPRGSSRTSRHWPSPIESYCAAVCDLGSHLRSCIKKRHFFASLG